MKLFFKHKLNQLSLKHKFLIILGSSIFFIGSASLLGMNIVMVKNNKLLYQTIAESMSYSSTEIEATLNNIKSLSGVIITDNQLQEKLTNGKTLKSPISMNDTAKDMQKILVSYLSQYNGNHIDSIRLYLKNRTVSTYLNRLETAPEAIMSPIREQAEPLRGGVLWTTDFTSEYGLILSRSVRQIKNLDLQNLGVVSIFIDLNDLVESSTNARNHYQDSFYFIFNEETPVYYSDSFSKEDAKRIHSMASSPYQIMDVNGKKFFSVKSDIMVNGSNIRYHWDYLCLIPYDTIYQSVFHVYISYFIIIMFTILLVWVMANWFIKNITRHFDCLILKMNLFRHRNMEILEDGYDYKSRSDELGLIHQNFDSMANEIKDLINVNYVNELLKKEAQLKALETQINPHFLYNTLETVNWRAKAIGEKEISSMVEALGTLLRMTLNKTEHRFTLKKELELVQSYMTIQQIRFEERLHYQMSVDPLLLDAKIPKLTIQPLVENAIYYGLEKITEDCYIQIQVSQFDSLLFIYVKNNGSLFEENLLMKLQQNKIETHGFGIGLLNIQKRLELTFGSTYGLDFYNEEELAVAKITIPYEFSDLRRNEHAEINDCR